MAYAEVDCQLFKAAVASSAARICDRRRIVMANNVKKVTTWWNQELKDVIQAKRVAHKVWLYN